MRSKGITQSLFTLTVVLGAIGLLLSAVFAKAQGEASAPSSQVPPNPAPPPVPAEASLPANDPLAQPDLSQPDPGQAMAQARMESAPLVPSIFTGFIDPYDYDARGRRDPFAQPIKDVAMEPGAIRGPLLPLQRHELNQLRLIGILWDVRNPKAMLKDPDGKLHIVGPNAKIGPRNGYVAVIREGEMVVVETIEQDGRLVSTAQVVKIAK